MPATSSALQLADVALAWSLTDSAADFVIIDGDVASDRGLETALLLSLELDARARDDDAPPSGDSTDRRGWWADEFADVEGDRIGSRLWLLARAKFVNETALSWKQYATEALQWMIEDRVASSIDITAQLVIRPGPSRQLLTTVTVSRPHGSPLSFRFAHTWDHQT